MSKTEVKLRFVSAATLSQCENLMVFCEFSWFGGVSVPKCLCVKGLCVKGLCVKAFVCKRVCV